MGEPTLIGRILLDRCLESEKTTILVVHRDTTQMFQMWRPRVAKSGGHLNYNTVTEVQDPDDAQSFSLALPQEAGAARSRLVPLLKEAVQVTSSRMVQTRDKVS
ncbi:hypothetical protein AGOR_G00107090 [Albula goreensis]|uniref:Uncharacterized protein n=1 Tax=Albula goreensis TaxID=1534307 RepID=A0A8T3DDH8_9TELE|nr:hypothetical protein AGOR_G00107090 [Albula goreensis]